MQAKKFALTGIGTLAQWEEKMDLFHWHFISLPFIIHIHIDFPAKLAGGVPPRTYYIDPPWSWSLRHPHQDEASNWTTGLRPNSMQRAEAQTYRKDFYRVHWPTHGVFSPQLWYHVTRETSKNYLSWWIKFTGKKKKASRIGVVSLFDKVYCLQLYTQ